MNKEPQKSLFDYTDEEWFGIEMVLMRGAGRRYKDPVEAVASVVWLKRMREMGRGWLSGKGIPQEQEKRLDEYNREYISLYHLGYNESDFILDELEEANKLPKGEKKEYHLKLSQEMYDYCKKRGIEIPKPIEDYFLRHRNAPSAEEIRDWYLKNKPNYSPKRSGELWRWVFGVSILAIPLFLIIKFPTLSLILAVGLGLILISQKKWGIAGVLWALFLIFRLILAILKQ